MSDKNLLTKIGESKLSRRSLLKWILDETRKVEPSTPTFEEAQEDTDPLWAL